MISITYRGSFFVVLHIKNKLLFFSYLVHNLLDLSAKRI